MARSRYSNPCEKPERIQRVGRTPASVETIEVDSVAEARRVAGEWYATQGSGYWPTATVMDAFETTLRMVGRARLACCDQHLLVILDNAASGDEPEAARS